MKVSQKVLVANIMLANPKITPKGVAGKTGLPLSRVYVLRNQAKQLIAEGKVTGKVKPKAVPVITVAKPEVTHESFQVKTLTQQVNKLTVDVEKLQTENNRLRHLYMDSKAVIRYLELKVEAFWGME